MIAILLMFYISSFFGPDGILSFLYSFLSVYVGHFMLHDDLFSFLPYSILHRYHHVNHSPFTYFFNILSECSMQTIGLVGNLISLNPWSVLFNMFIYISVHYINCSWLHINEYHEKHHTQIDTNMAPDILDTLFGTKHPDTPQWEDTTHMIPNVIIAALLVFWLKSQYHESWNYRFCYVSIGLFLLLTIVSFYRVTI